MKEILKKKGIVIAIAAVLVAIVSAVSIRISSGNSDVFSGIVNTVTQPFKSAMTAVVRGLEQVYGYLYEYDKIAAENETLKAQVAQLEEEYREYAEVSEENARLRALLDLNERHSDFKFETASVIAWTSSNWSSSFTIGKGTDAGLALHDCVVTEMGYVIGQITEITATSATVTTILDTASSVGATVYKTGENAVAQGEFSLMGEGLLRLSYLPENADFVTGDAIVTSGKGGEYPRGLVIGYVENAGYSASGIDMYATVRPAAELEELLYVFVITDFEMVD